MFVWSLVIGFNIPGVKKLFMTKEILVGIYNGTINNWKDKRLEKLNPNLTFPNASIRPVARLESSGSTYIFTSSLSSFDSSWKEKYGVFKRKKKWPSVVKLFGQRTTGVADLIMNEVYSLGYLAMFEAEEVEMGLIDFVDGNGKIIPANLENIQNSLKFANRPSDSLSFSLVDVPNSYPFSSFAYLVLNTSILEEICPQMVELYRFVDWILSSKASKVNLMKMNLVPLTSYLIQVIKNKILHKMTCRGELIRDLASKQIAEEEEKLKTWKNPVIISSVIVGIIFLVVVFIFAYDKYKYIKKLRKENWRINFFDVTLASIKCQVIKVPKEIPFELDIGFSRVLQQLESMNLYGCFDNKNISLIPTSLQFQKPTFSVSQKINNLKNLNHNNIANFHGLSSSPSDQHFYIEEACEKKSVLHFLEQKLIPVDNSIRLSIARDLCRGLGFLHNHKIFLSYFHLHQCLIDFRWSVKIGSWAFSTLHQLDETKKQKQNKITKFPSYFIPCETPQILEYLEFWMAPEISGPSPPEPLTDKTVIFSLGLVLLALFSVNSIYSEIKKESSLKVEKLKKFSEQFFCVPQKIITLVNLCCQMKPLDRPTLDVISTSLRSQDSNHSFSLLDHIIKYYENNSFSLEI